MTDHWLKLENEQLQAQNAELRARLRALQDEYAMFALPGEELAPLTAAERVIVKTLYDRGGRPVCKAGIHSVLYGLRHDDEVPDPKIIDVLVCKLRRKLKQYRVETHWGQGYSLHAREIAA